jgi:RNA polymerase sigma factor (TIGR02999 family)
VEINDAQADVSALLQAWSQGHVEARDRLMEVVYQELRRRAAAYLRRERAGHTVQPTALVHEAYVRLVDQHAVWQNRAQFLGVASRITHRILVDRARKTAKRSGQWARVTLDELLAEHQPRDVHVLDLDAALTALTTFAPVRARSPT